MMSLGDCVAIDIYRSVVDREFGEDGCEPPVPTTDLERSSELLSFEQSAYIG
jgi:hypothetical protein